MQYSICTHIAFNFVCLFFLSFFHSLLFLLLFFAEFSFICLPLNNKILHATTKFKHAKCEKWKKNNHSNTHTHRLLTNNLIRYQGRNIWHTILNCSLGEENQTPIYINWLNKEFIQNLIFSLFFSLYQRITCCNFNEIIMQVWAQGEQKYNNFNESIISTNQNYRIYINFRNKNNKQKMNKRTNVRRKKNCVCVFELRSHAHT